MNNKEFDELVLELPPIIKDGDSEYFWRLIRLGKEVFEIGYYRLNYVEQGEKKNPVLFFELGRTPSECLKKLIETYNKRK